MATVSYKAQAIAHELADKLKQRLSLTPTMIVTEAVDPADSYPYISISDGTPATLEPNFIIKVNIADWANGLDVLGLAQTQFTPHRIQVATEADTTGGAAADPTTRAQLLPVIGQCLAMGCAVEWWEEAAGTIPALTTFTTAAKLKATYYPDQQYPLISQQ
jgi:hypothetical protein